MKWQSRIISIVLAITILCGLLSSALIPAHAAGTVRKSLNVSKTLKAPIIDGKLDESIWHIDHPIDVKLGGTTVPNSRFGLLWDNKYLYIAVMADDDKLVHNASGYWFEQDNINLFFDPTRHQSAPFATDDMQIGFVYQPGTTTPEFHFGAALNNHSAKDDKKILRAIQTNATGWSLEVAVPWDMLNMDPIVTKQLGFEIGTTDRDQDGTPANTGYWSAFQSESFWNDTSGYGTLTLDDQPVGGDVSDVLFSDNFDSYRTGDSPFGWISDVNAGSSPMTVLQDTYGNGSLVFDGNAAGKQGRITAPVQWDNYVVEADVKFLGVLNSARWASIMFRGAANGKNPYNQMAIRQNGTYEFAYRQPDNSWVVPASGVWKPLALNTDYHLKARVFDNNVKEYIKSAKDADFTLLMNKSFDTNLLERGKIGFQADQSKVAFDNLKVTRVTAEHLDIQVAGSLEALTGPVSVTNSVYFSDGISESVPVSKVKLYSSDPTVMKVINNQLYPLKEGKATVKAVYYNAESQKEITVTPSTKGAQVVSLTSDTPYVLAVIGQTIDLVGMTFKADYNDFTQGTVKGDQLNWTSDSKAVIMENGKLKNVTAKGVYIVKASMDAASVNVVVVAKNQADAEYVLYEENFDSLPDGSLPSGWTRKEGTTASAVGVKAQAFEMDATKSPDNPSRILLPDYLGNFGDYKIEADITHLAANDSARWNSIMYRIQNNNSPYYQMAVRQNATASNGVEFAERTSGNTWNVIDKGAFSEPIQSDRLYHYTVKAFGNRVQQFVNDQLIVDTDMANAYSKGKIGLQANGSKMKVDNIRVTLQDKPLPPLPADRFVHVTEPQTSISLAPTIVTELQSKAGLTGLSGDTGLPATVILNVSNDLTITDRQGRTAIGTLDSVLDALGTRMIPAFYVRSSDTIDRLVELLKKRGVEDAFVMSDKVDLVLKARAAYPIIRGIVDFTGVEKIATGHDNENGKNNEQNQENEDKSDNDNNNKTYDALRTKALMNVVGKTNGSSSKIAVLPEWAASKENVAYLQEREITVWVQANSFQKDETLSIHKIITAGVNGVITNAVKTAWDSLKVYSHNTTLIRKPFVVAHRGIPAMANENTMDSVRLAYEKGADMVENDIYLTKDGRLVVIHDPTLDRTTTGTGKVEDYSLEQLRAFKANKQFPTQYPDALIPTLDEYFDYVKDKDFLVLVEIKSYKPEIIDALVKLIKDKGVADKVLVHSFIDSQLKLLVEKMPEITVGFLTGGIANEANVNKSLRDTLRAVQPINAAFHTSYPGLGKKYMEAAKHRGITIFPWTFTDRNEFIKYFLMGTQGLINNNSYWVSDWAEAITAERNTYTIRQGDKLSLHAAVKTYKNDIKNVVPDVILLDGQELVDVSGNMMTPKKKGTVHALLRYTASIDGGPSYDLYTQPITIEVKGGSEKNKD